jgi:hypothetical protein
MEIEGFHWSTIEPIVGAHCKTQSEARIENRPQYIEKWV